MKQTFAIIIGLILSFGVLSAQPYSVGYVNTETILAQIPDYVSAQQTLEKLSNQYKTIIENETTKIDVAYRAYQAERARLSEEQKQQRERDIIEMERAVKEKQKAYFGEDGIMAKKYAELMDPIKSRVEKAIETLAVKRGLSLVIDVSSVQGIVYKNAEYDLSLEVVKYLGK